MSGTLLFAPTLTVFDDEGLSLPNAELYAYQAGTTAPAALYVDAALSTAATNPVIADSRGQFPPLYRDPEITYKIEVRRASPLVGHPGEIIMQADPYEGGADAIAVNAVRDDLAATKLEVAGEKARVDSLAIRADALETQDFGNPNPLAEAALATTANITRSGEQTIDGITTSASRILVKDQTDASENGVYVTGSGAWTRATDANTADRLAFGEVYIAGGTVNTGRTYRSLSTSTTVLETDDITFALVNDASAFGGRVTQAEADIDAAEGNIATINTTLDASLSTEAWNDITVFANEQNDAQKYDGQRVFTVDSVTAMQGAFLASGGSAFLTALQNRWFFTQAQTDERNGEALILRQWHTCSSNFEAQFTNAGIFRWATTLLRRNSTVISNLNPVPGSTVTFESPTRIQTEVPLTMQSGDLEIRTDFRCNDNRNMTADTFIYPTGEFEIVRAEAMSAAEIAASRVTAMLSEPEQLKGETHLVVGAGQSLATAYAAWDGGLDFPADKVFQMGRDGVDDRKLLKAARPMQHHTSPGGAGDDGFGTFLTFARNHRRARPDQNLVFQPCGYGGSGFSNGFWNPGDDIHEDLIKRVNEALTRLPNVTQITILWQQGEQAAQANDGATYEASLDACFNSFLTRINTDIDIKIIVGQICIPAGINDSTAIRAILADTPNRFPGVAAFVDSDGIPTSDGTHPTAAGFREFGERFFDAWVKLSGATQYIVSDATLRIAREGYAYAEDWAAGDANGWVATRAALTFDGDGMTVTQNNQSVDTMRIDKGGLAIDGSRFDMAIVEVTIHDTASDFSDDRGVLFWASDTLGFSESRKGGLRFPVDQTLGKRQFLVYDMAGSALGGSQWVNETITDIRLDVVAGDGASYTLHSIQIVSSDHVAIPGVAADIEARLAALESA